MTTATYTETRRKFDAVINSMSDEAILEALRQINKPWDQFKPEERMTRAAMLGEYERRHGGDAVDALMDILDRAAAMG